MKEFFAKIGEEIGAAIGVALAAAIAYVVSIVKEYFANLKTKKRENFEITLKRDRFIGDLLVEVRNEFQADDICLFQVEEEKVKGAGALEILKMTYEREKPYFNPWINNAQRIIIRDYPRTEERLKVSPYVMIKEGDTNSDEENSLLGLVMQSGMAGVILVLIPSAKKKALGALWLSYIHEVHQPSDFDLVNLKKYVKQMSYLLTEYE